jgi:hypothetical protein
VHEVLAPDLRRNFDQPNGPQFTDLCAELLRQLHARGITQQQIEAALRSMYFVSLFVFVAAVNSSGLREMRVGRAVTAPHSSCRIGFVDESTTNAISTRRWREE